MDTSECKQADSDANCCSDGVAADLPGTEPAPVSSFQGMTACKAAPLIQKRIG